MQPTRVERLYKEYWKDNKVRVLPHLLHFVTFIVWLLSIKICCELPSTLEIRDHTQRSLGLLRVDHKRALNPTPYKVRVLVLSLMIACDTLVVAGIDQ